MTTDREQSDEEDDRYTIPVMLTDGRVAYMRKRDLRYDDRIVLDPPGAFASPIRAQRLLNEAIEEAGGFEAWKANADTITRLRSELAEARRDADRAREGEPWRDHVEERIRGWRQQTMNRSGDLLAIDDLMSADDIDDLVDYVCDEWAHPPASAGALSDEARDGSVDSVSAVPGNAAAQQTADAKATAEGLRTDEDGRLFYGKNKWLGYVFVNDDGFYVWEPIDRPGYIPGPMLKELAELLERMNAPWAAQVAAEVGG